MNPYLVVGVLGIASILGGLSTVLVAAVLDARGHDGPFVFALVWTGAISCSLGVLAVVGAFLVAAVTAIP